MINLSEDVWLAEDESEATGEVLYPFFKSKLLVFKQRNRTVVAGIGHEDVPNVGLSSPPTDVWVPDRIEAYRRGIKDCKDYRVYRWTEHGEQIEKPEPPPSRSASVLAGHAHEWLKGIKIPDGPTTTRFQRYNDQMLTALARIRGMKARQPHLEEKFGIRAQKVPPNFKMIETKTGRPSNTRAGINLAALDSEERQCFESEHGILVQIDYDAFHLRLAAKLRNAEVPKDRKLHEYLSDIYGEDYSYDEAKRATFKIMYNKGGVPEEMRQIPILKAIHDLSVENSKQEAVTTGLFERRLPNTESLKGPKALSYFLQATGAEFVLNRAFHCQNALEGGELVHYLYDSLVFDLPDESEVRKLQKIMEGDGSMKTDVKIGRLLSDLDT